MYLDKLLQNMYLALESEEYGKYLYGEDNDENEETQEIMSELDEPLEQKSPYFELAVTLSKIGTLLTTEEVKEYE